MELGGALKSATLPHMNLMTRDSNRRRARIVFLIAWVFAIVIRCLWPLADPPADLSWSGGYMADEGFWVHDARNIALFGETGPDEWHNRYVSPLIHPPILLLFRLMGPGLLPVRLWGCLLALLTLLILDRISRRIDPSGILFLCFALNSILIAYQRTAILECAVLPPACLTLLLWLKARESNASHQTVWIDILTGVAAAVTWLIKGTQIFFPPAVLLATLLSEPSFRRARRALLHQAGGMISVAGIWFFTVKMPHAELLGQYNSYYISQQGSTLIDGLKNILLQPVGIYFSRVPVLFPAAILLSLSMLVRKRFRLEPSALTFAWVWFLAGVVFLAPFGYRPLRYYLPLLIPIIILGWRFVSQRDVPSLPVWMQWIIILITLMLMLTPLPLLLDRYWFHGRWLGMPDIDGIPGVGPVLGLLIACFVLFPRFLKRKPITGKILTGILIVSCLFHAVTAVNRLVNRRYDVLAASRELSEHLPEHAVIAGQWAPQLCLETPYRAIPMWTGFVNDTAPRDRFGITHVLSWEYALGNELTFQKQWFPEMMNNARRMAVFRIKNSDVSLWEIPDDPGSEHANPQQFPGRQTTEHLQ